VTRNFMAGFYETKLRSTSQSERLAFEQICRTKELPCKFN